MNGVVYQLMPLNCGECRIGENHLFGDPHSDDDRVDFTLYAFLADGGPGRRVLVDLGPVVLDYLNDMFRRYDFFRNIPGDPDDITQPQGNVLDWLAQVGLSPKDVDHIVLTHIHADHHGLTDARDGGAVLRFPNARIHVSRIGWQANLDKRVEGRWNSYVDYAFSDFLLEGEKSGKVLFHDNDGVIPGIDVIYLGGHSICSQAVRIQTAAGPAIITSDEVYRYDLLAKGLIAQLNTTPERLAAALEKLVDLALDGAILLPCHDPVLARLYREYGDDWLQQIKPLSDKAAGAFREAPKQTVG